MPNVISTQDWTTIGLATAAAVARNLYVVVPVQCLFFAVPVRRGKTYYYIIFVKSFSADDALSSSLNRTTTMMMIIIIILSSCHAYGNYYYYYYYAVRARRHDDKSVGLRISWRERSRRTRKHRRETSDGKKNVRSNTEIELIPRACSHRRLHILF